MKRLQSLGVTKKGKQILREATTAGCITLKEIVRMLPPSAASNEKKLASALDWLSGIFLVLGITVVPSSIKEIVCPSPRTPSGRRRNENSSELGRVLADSRENLEYEADILRIYLDEAKQFEQLPDKEVDRLSALARKRDYAARNKLVEHNLLFAVFRARRYLGLELEYPDLIQEANLGLIRCAELYNRRRGATFSTYAVLWINQAIRRALANERGAVRVPVHVRDLWHKILKVAVKLAHKLGRPPYTQEIARELVIAERTVVNTMLHCQQTPLSLDFVDEEDGDGEEDGKSFYNLLVDHTFLTPEERVEAREDMREALSRALKNIQSIQDVLATLPSSSLVSSRNCQVFRNYYGLDGSFKERTLQDIAQDHGLTRQRVQQIVSKIWRELEGRKVGIDEATLLGCIRALPDLWDRVLELETEVI